MAWLASWHSTYFGTTAQDFLSLYTGWACNPDMIALDDEKFFISLQHCQRQKYKYIRQVALLPETYSTMEKTKASITFPPPPQEKHEKIAN